MESPSLRKREAKPDQQTEIANQPSLLKLESNEPRFPIFSLRTKDLEAIDGYVYRGVRTFNGSEYQFEFRVTRNTDTPYPGTLARKAHRAVLSIVSEQGFPLEQPISWTWRQLCRRMRISYSGRTVTKLKGALLAITGLLIQSKQAIIIHNGKTFSTSKDKAVHLYDQLVFKADQMPDGSVANRNYVWLADWYVENLNANYYHYLDYELWQILDMQSPIASRLYEIALSKFHTHSLLRINYPTLANLMPVVVHDRISRAKQQLSRHFDIAVKAGVLAEPAWEKRKGETVAQLLLRPGPALQKIKQNDIDSEETIDNISVKELRTQRKTTAAKLISIFYTDFVGKDRHPSKKELLQAQRYIERFGNKKVTTLMPLVILQLKDNWPKAKTFQAVDRYIDDALQDFERKESAKRRRRQQQLQAAKEQEATKQQEAADKTRTAQLEARWQQTTTQQRDAILQHVLDNNKFLQQMYHKDPDSSLIHELCLSELDSRTAA